MKVKELIKQLQALDGDLEITTTCACEGIPKKGITPMYPAERSVNSNKYLLINEESSWSEWKKTYANTNRDDIKAKVRITGTKPKFYFLYLEDVSCW